jgi:hypothetical protein
MIKFIRNNKISVMLVIVLTLAGIACHLACGIIGQEIDADGYLREPFALIPIGFLFYFLAIAVVVIRGLVYIVRRLQTGMSKPKGE